MLATDHKRFIILSWVISSPRIPKFTYRLHVQTKINIKVDVTLTLSGKRFESFVGNAIDESNNLFA